MKVLVGGLAALALSLLLSVGHTPAQPSLERSVSTQASAVTEPIDWP
ncbi:MULTISPECIES: hypothetical protein [Streptomyces]|uniref:Uncharacterized protein n=1 Tax=Streptomyces flaveolus TaxID=67297 RepID=A0ABV3AGZ5_9ACTN|nr:MULTISPECIES: hypothetical protein [Streptomyces]